MIARRAWLSQIALGAAGLLCRPAPAADAFAQGVITVRGEARIDGAPAVPGMPVRSGADIVTGTGAELVLVAHADAVLVRANSRIRLAGPAGAVTDALRVLSGAILAVFAPGRQRMLRTATATIGIRGTAGYVEVQPDRTYVCICYGTADLAAVDDPGAAETVTTRHHDEPRYIYRRGMPAMIEAAPVVNHTDAELTLLEGLVGRKPPFYGAY